MTKTIALILVTLFSVACGGEPFTGTELDAVGGEAIAGEAGTAGAAGSPTVSSAGAPSGGASVAQGGASDAGAAGSSVAGKPAGGASQGGTGGAPVTCELSPERLTAALPKAFIWKDFMVASGSVCAHCIYEPCSQLSTAWGEPTVLGDHVNYTPIYTRTTAVSLLVSVGKNDGACISKVACEMQPETISVGFSMSRDGDAWKAVDVSVFVTFVSNNCMDGIGKPEELTDPVAKDLEDEIRASVIGLKIPCN